MIYVKAINWISSSGDEADLLITDGTYECVVFCHPGILEIGKRLDKPLVGFMCKDVMISHTKGFSITQIKSNSFEHKGIGKIINRDDGLVQVGEILIKLEKSSLPGDVKNDDYIEFTCGRLDVWSLEK